MRPGRNGRLRLEMSMDLSRLIVRLILDRSDAKVEVNALVQ
jgi:hypothetical protein